MTHPLEAAADLHRQGRLLEAEALYRQILATAPDQPGVHNDLGVVLAKSGQVEAALASFDRAVALEPGAAAAQCNRGNALVALGRREEAVASFDAAIALQPDYAEAHANRGIALIGLRRFEEAGASLGVAVGLRPGHAHAHHSLGYVQMRLGQGDAAVRSFDRAIAIRPGFADSHFKRALALLSLGRFAEGWPGYEHRWEVAGEGRPVSDQMTPELGARMARDPSRRDLAGRRVLLIGEQGLGDVLMFASLVPDVVREAAAVTLLCDPRLKGLFSNSFPQVKVFAHAGEIEDPAPFDQVVALGSLGGLYRNQITDFPSAPYLVPRAAWRDRWAARLGPGSGRLRVGLSWRGGLAGTRRDERSLPLAALRPVLDLPGCEFVSLQYGEHGPEIDAVQADLDRPIRVFDAAELEDIEALAGLVQALDIVVSVQTSLAHLCGAIGAPCLAMLPAVAEWRYGQAGSVMPWYGSVSLLRQPRAGAWGEVVNEVAARLGTLSAR